MSRYYETCLVSQIRWNARMRVWRNCVSINAQPDPLPGPNTSMCISCLLSCCFLSWPAQGLTEIMSSTLGMRMPECRGICNPLRSHSQWGKPDPKANAVPMTMTSRKEIQERSRAAVSDRMAIRVLYRPVRSLSARLSLLDNRYPLWPRNGHGTYRTLSEETAYSLIVDYPA